MIQKNVDLTKILLGIINAETNQFFLKGVPYHEFLDLAIIYYVLIEKENGGYERSVLTTEEFVSIGLSKDELYSIALENTFALCPPVIRPMLNEMELVMMGFRAGDIDGLNQKIRLQMILVTNQMLKGGAVALLSYGPFHAISEYLQDDIYILPSYVDELLVVGCKGHDPEALVAIVREINQSLLNPEQVLSDSIYLIKRGEPRVYQIMQV